MYQLIRSSINECPAYRPSALRWIGATIATAILAPIFFTLPFVVGSYFIKDFNFVDLMTGAFGLLFMVLLFGTPLAFIPVCVTSFVCYLLFRLFKIKSLLLYIFCGTVITILEFKFLEAGADKSFPKTFWNGITFGLYASTPAAVAYWLMVWWPLVKQRWGRYGNGLESGPVSEIEPNRLQRILGMKHQLDRTSRQCEGCSRDQGDTL